MRPGPSKRLRRRRALVTALAAAFLLTLDVCPAWAQGYLPPSGKLIQGEAGAPAAVYAHDVRKHPAVVEAATDWGGTLPSPFVMAARSRARLLLDISTAAGVREAVTPGSIAAGADDRWLLSLGQAIAVSGHPVYINLMPGMDGYWNFYSAYNSDGSPRGSSRSTAAFRSAWKRVTLILRGGSLAHINAVLARLGMPPVQHTTQDLPAGAVAMLWTPDLAPEPDIPANRPRAYWPGRPWVDWVGTDFSSRDDDFTALSSFYATFASAPFAFADYGLLGTDDPGYVRRLLGWVGAHPRARMLIYNEGHAGGDPHRLIRYPRAARALRRALAASRFPPFVADW